MKRTPTARLDEAVVDRLTTALRSAESFKAVAGPAVAQAVRLGTLVELGQGEILIREGDPSAPEIYLLVEGALAVQSKGEFVARLDRPGDVVGEVAVLLSSRRTADVVAESAVRVIAVPAKALAQPEFAPLAASVRSAMLRDDWVQY